MHNFQLSHTASKLLGLVPKVICKRETNVTDVLEKYSNDIPSPELFIQELTRWKSKYTLKPETQWLTSCAGVLSECDMDLFPNICSLLKIGCTPSHFMQMLMGCKHATEVKKPHVSGHDRK